jgi:hypothetical protein
MERLATLLFGLDTKHLLRCSSGERFAYSKAALYFIMVIVATFLSLYYFFYLLSLSYSLSFPLAAVLTFVFFSILRFILLTIQLPIGEVVTMKKLIVNGANIFRIVLFMLLVFTLIVPLCAFIFRNPISKDLQGYKNQVYINFAKSKEHMIEQQLGSISVLIEKKEKEQRIILNTENNIRIQAFKIRHIQKQKDALEKKLRVKKALLAKKNRHLLAHFRKELKHAGMPFKRFELLFNQPSSGITLFLLFVLLFLLLPAYMYVRYATSYLYGKYFGDEMMLVIAAEYSKMKKDCSEYLLKNYNYSLSHESLYEDPPFNRIRIDKAPTRITTIKLFDYFEEPQ